MVVSWCIVAFLRSVKTAVHFLHDRGCCWIYFSSEHFCLIIKITFLHFFTELSRQISMQFAIIIDKLTFEMKFALFDHNHLVAIDYVII